MTNNAHRHHWKAEDYHLNSSAQSIAASQLLQHVKLKGNEKILDVGCGDGKITSRISEAVPAGTVVGIDTSKQMIDFAQKKFTKNLHQNLTFLVQDAQRLPYDQEFDIIFSSFALQWVLDQNLFFSGAYKSLRPSGYLALTIPLGVSSELEKSIDTVLLMPEWSLYFKNFSKTWNFLSKIEFEKLLLIHGFLPLRLTVASQQIVFSSREHFEKYVLTWFPYLEVLPERLKQSFFKQIIDKYLELKPLLLDGSVDFTFPRIDIIATKTTL